MGQAAKYIVLALVFTTIIGLALSIINQMYPNEILNNFLGSMINVLSRAQTVIMNVRGCINYVLGGHLPLTIAIFLWAGFPFLRVAYKVVIMVYRWFNQ